MAVKYTNIRQRKAFKDKAEQFKQDKTCKLCGSNEDLAVHHTNKHDKQYVAHIKEFLNTELRHAGIRLNRLDYLDMVKGVMDALTPLEQHYDKIITDRYMDFSDCIVLCKKCHIADHHGRELCPMCKTHYKSKQYETCFECLPDEDKIKINTAIANRKGWNEKMQQIENEDMESERWIQEFNDAAPERQDEMLQEKEGEEED